MRRVIRSILAAGLMHSAAAGLARADGPASRPAVAAAHASDTVAFLGVSAKSLDPALRAQLQLPEGLGLSVQFVGHDSPAANDLKVGDVLQKLDDQLLVNTQQLQALIRMHKPGDTVKLSIIRETRPMEVTVKLGERHRPAETSGDFRPPDPFEIPDGPDLSLPLGNRANNMSMSFSDNTYSAQVATDKDGHKLITVKDKAGTVVAEGPVDTEEQFKQLPEDVQTHLKVLNTMLFHPRAKR
jgi:hypothetical protein